MNTNVEAFGYIAAVSFASLSPGVHMMHGNPGRAAASFALHTAAPVAFAFIGSRLERCDEGELLCGLEGTGLGLMTGMATATLIDALVLARPKHVAHTNMAFTIAPTFKVSPSGGATFGIVGTM